MMLRKLLYLLCGAASLSAQNIEGEWIAQLKFFDNIDYRRMTLHQQDGRITGRSGEAELTGSVSGGRIEIAAKMARGPEGTFSGEFKDGAISGKAHWQGREMQWTASRPKARPADAPRQHTFEPKEFHRLFSGAIPPALRIYPGDSVKTWSVDAGGWDAAGVRRSPGGNPQTGPFYIEGSLPGDTLVVRLTRVRLNRDTAISGGSIAGSALNPYYMADLKKVEKYDSSWRLDREKGVARLANPTGKLKNYSVPIRPMLGCVGVAPAAGMAFRTGFLGSYGGNMDYNQIREGVTLYLPVFQPGALLFMGDGHAAQGDGELTGDALETSMDIEFTVELIEGKSAGAPRAENDEYFMAMGIAGSAGEALREATTNMARWLERDWGLNPAEVASVLGTAMRYDIAEVVDPYVNVVAKVSKQALSQIAK
ncbi:MAG TPA: acetamidase/formamidase family protein [Bryobacteraceae bacterium]|nr:acetamidase/formamidase family protein [Bryobacteraceae bacterium]